jgi:hypothetical protein
MVCFISYLHNISIISKYLFIAPVEWLTLIIPFNGFQIYSEIRQGFFLTVLLTFWLFFAGEHSIVSRFPLNNEYILLYIHRIKVIIRVFGPMENI